MTTELLCTLGPASYHERVIQRLDELGASLFRINLSHTTLDELAGRIEFIQRNTAVPICIDTEGAQIRTGNFAHDSFVLKEGSTIRIHAKQVPGDDKDICLYPLEIVERLREGDFVSIDFNSVLVQVSTFEEGHRVAVARVINGGTVGRNKAVTVDRDIALPALTGKDIAAIEIARKHGIRHFALSFAGRGPDVDQIRGLGGSDSTIISKIESLSGLENLTEIARLSDAILIDRGDLSRQLPIERIPRAQKEIIAIARSVGRRVYVATNLLESMITAGTPTRAEVNDVYNTLLDGASGLVLAAETAIGVDPVKCATMIVRLVHEFEKPSEQRGTLTAEAVSLLVPPHGGRLVQRYSSTAENKDIGSFATVELGLADLLDCEQIAHGTYSPLEGFMDRATLESVLSHNRLPNGTVWTMPLLLQIDAQRSRRFGIGDRIVLTDANGARHAIMDVTDIYRYDLDELSNRWFGTASADHPGVARIRTGGDCFVAGSITLIAPLSTEYRHFALTPAQSRFVFAHKGWSRVVGFHTRNPAHRVHEFIQMRALQRTNADGLFISPVVGPKKRDDFLPAPIMHSYQILLEAGIYPPGRVVLGCFPTYSRYCGPREAVFTALCRKNMGCSHFIVGRDHTGVGNFYPPDGNKQLFDELGDIGIDIVQFDAIGYDHSRSTYTELKSGDGVDSISGTEVRDSLRAGRPLPDWFMRDIVQQSLRSDLAAGLPMFVD